ncbi:four-helix bundle copper-binding protein [Legionella septentrionalis]|uniref:Four-helix bundle copper-binding protein n=1 Tax=Legionella septentrionalis TaxID=2498109 RepID=A0A433JGQ3_9GAMM|nr:four-helix bundle copper-binding protein [Legionella septentrionalis]RUQ81007.1 four-helix bundle copper-binding protein [Legionella septentrionalis]RUR08754.1 four-helix bundle copper-binding protein [Legionella septentrionalis]RUR13318.1 four-helix bundle copper-binding protein [Legionella septentrionalis]
MSHENYQSCIDACHACATACEHCANSCLEEQTIQQLASCIKLDIDCTDICILTAKLLARGSEFALPVSLLCADICKTCGDECSKHQDMEHCKRCAEACYRCEAECRKIASA